MLIKKLSIVVVYVDHLIKLYESGPEQSPLKRNCKRQHFSEIAKEYKKGKKTTITLSKVGYKQNLINILLKIRKTCYGVISVAGDGWMRTA